MYETNETFCLLISAEFFLVDFFAWFFPIFLIPIRCFCNLEKQQLSYLNIQTLTYRYFCGLVCLFLRFLPLLIFDKPELCLWILIIAGNMSIHHINCFYIPSLLISLEPLHADHYQTTTLIPTTALCAKIGPKTHLIAYSSQIPTYMKRNDMIVHWILRCTKCNGKKSQYCCSFFKKRIFSV